MPPGYDDLSAVLRDLAPVRQPGTFVFVCVDPNVDLGGLAPVATMRESEGVTLVLEEGQAVQRGFSIAFRAAWITLCVHSDLALVGLTAVVAQALAAAGISCNVIAGVHHDHLFVPVDDAERALAALARA